VSLRSGSPNGARERHDALRHPASRPHRLALGARGLRSRGQDLARVRRAAVGDPARELGLRSRRPALRRPAAHARGPRGHPDRTARARRLRPPDREHAAARRGGRRDAAPLPAGEPHRAARDLAGTRHRGVAVRAGRRPRRRERAHLRARRLRVRRGPPAPGPARDRRLDADRVHVRRVGVGRAADPARPLVGDAPLRRADRARGRRAAARPRSRAPRALRLGERGAWSTSSTRTSPASRRRDRPSIRPPLRTGSVPPGRRRGRRRLRVRPGRKPSAPAACIDAAGAVPRRTRRRSGTRRGRFA